MHQCPPVRQIGRHDSGTQQENWDVTELRSRATFSIAVLHPPYELAFGTHREDRAEAEIQISALFPVSEQGHARRYKAPHSMGRIPPSPPYSFRPRKKHWIN